MNEEVGQEFSGMFHAHDKTRARRVLNGQHLADCLWEYVKPKTVIDLGCGLGFFLKACADKGAKIQPVDGDWVKDLSTEVDKDSYVFADLNEPFSDTKRYDLAASIEVAEHLKPARSRGFVSDLCGLSNIVLFSAGVPGQGGSGHINLKFQDAWARIFAQEGYSCYDPLRRPMAAKEGVYKWFIQNTLLFVKDGTKISAKLSAQKIVPKAAAMVTKGHYQKRVISLKRKIARLRGEIEQLQQDD